MLDVKFRILNPLSADTLTPPQAPSPIASVTLASRKSPFGHNIWKAELSGERENLWYRTGTNYESHFEKVFSSPRMAMLSGKRAAARLGDKFPVVSFVPASESYEVSYRELGVKLETQAYVLAGEDKRVFLRLKLVTTFLDEILNGFPVVLTRQNQLELVVQDGEEVTISGFRIQPDKVKDVPLLAVLPTLGSLFLDSQSSRRLVLSIKVHSFP